MAELCIEENGRVNHTVYRVEEKPSVDECDVAKTK